MNQVYSFHLALFIHEFCKAKRRWRPDAGNLIRGGGLQQTEMLGFDTFIISPNLVPLQREVIRCNYWRHVYQPTIHTDLA